MRIVSARTAAEVDQVRQLFRDYWDSFGFTPCFQGFGAEVAALPGAYAPPGGDLLLALDDAMPAGCAAFRRYDATRAEAKRLFVRPEFRGRGIGRALLTAVIDSTRAAGYSEIIGDTMPEHMGTALALYDRWGFERTEPYAADPTPGAVYLRFKL
jgi:putative acetyltransferase